MLVICKDITRSDFLEPHKYMEHYMKNYDSEIVIARRAWLFENLKYFLKKYTTAENPLY